MFRQKNLVLAVFATAAAAALIATQTAGTNANEQANKLTGAWITSVPGTPMLFNGVFAPSDSSGRSAVVYGSLLVRIPGEVLDADVPPIDHGSDFVGEVAMTGPDTAKLTMIGHAINKVMPSPLYPFFEKVAYVWVANGDLKFTAPGKIDCTFTINDYPAGEDGLPAAGQPSFFTMSGLGKMTRVGLPK